jgi:WD40 repeat protein
MIVGPTNMTDPIININGTQATALFLPAEVIGEHVASFLDRVTLNKLALANRRLHGMIQNILRTMPHPPWPNNGGKLFAKSNILSMEFSPNTQVLACATNKGTVQLWNCTDGRCTILNCKDGDDESDVNTDEIQEVKSVTFSPDGQYLACSYTCLLVWKLATPTCELDNNHHHNNHHHNTYTGYRRCYVQDSDCTSVAFSPDSQLLASCWTNDHQIWLWNLAEGTCVQKLHHFEWNNLSSVVFSPTNDGTLACAGSVHHGGHAIFLWDPNNSTTTATATASTTHTTIQPIQPLLGHGCLISKVVYSPNGRFLASSSDDSTIRLWSVADRSCACILKGRLSGWIVSLAFSPSGTSVASADECGSVRLWNAVLFLREKEKEAERSDRCIATFKGHVDYVGAVAFSSDGRTLASASSDETIRFWGVCE